MEVLVARVVEELDGLAAVFDVTKLQYQDNLIKVVVRDFYIIAII